jgi:hypothetical protein
MAHLESGPDTNRRASRRQSMTPPRS